MTELKQYNITLKDRNKSSHLLALRALATERFTRVGDWESFMMTLAHMRKKKFPWSPTCHVSASESVRDWLLVTPILKDWIYTDDCFISPSKWPDEVYSAFKHRLIPSPYDIANVDMSNKYVQSERAFRNYLVLLAYCLGLEVSHLAKGYLTSETEILRRMHSAIEDLFEIPQFLLWATATDFRKCVYPPALMRVSLRKRMRFLAALQSNPFLADDILAKQLIQNSTYFSYLIYGSPKRMRLTKGCRIYRTGEQNGS